MLSGSKKVPAKGIGISIVAGVIMAFFYRFVAASIDLSNFADPAPGKLTPYTRSLSLRWYFCQQLFVNTIAMRHPVEGEPIRIGGYFRGSLKTHCVGVLEV